MATKLTTETRRVRLAIKKANLVLKNEFQIRRTQTLVSGGWAGFLKRKPTRIDPRLRISDFSFNLKKKRYPRSTQDLDVIPGRG